MWQMAELDLEHGFPLGYGHAAAVAPQVWQQQKHQGVLPTQISAWQKPTSRLSHVLFFGLACTRNRPAE
jgi:hypothetical protein